MAINTKHPQYTLNKPKWDKCTDAYDGEDTIKARGTAYLPKLSGQTDTQYKGYKSRGMFFGATEKTINTLVGLLLNKPPLIKVPSKIEYMVDDATGTGLNLNSFIKQIAQQILLTGRYGVLLDRDKVEDIESPRVFAMGYDAQEITNWISDNDEVLAVVLDDSSYEETDEIYELVLVEKLKEIKFIEGGVNVVTHTKEDKDYVPNEATPLTIRGAAMESIPFTFINPVGVSVEIEKPPFLDLVNVVIAHWKNSVDLEHGRHWCAIPTPYITGANFSAPVRPPVAGEDIDTNKTKEATFSIGGETAWVLPKDATVGFLEFSGTGLEALEKALEHKEKLIAVLGSRMLEQQKKAVESAETSRNNKIGESSTLTNVATAIESGVKNFLQNVAKWEGVDPDLVEVEFNKDFIDAKIDPTMIKTLLETYLADGISLETFLYNLNNGEILPEDTKVEDEIDKIDLQVAKKGLTDIFDDDENTGGEGEKTGDGDEEK